MTKKQKSLLAYDWQPMAERYHHTGGFAPLRKEKLLEVTLDLLITLTTEGATLLELGAGTGHFTRKIIEANHFSKIQVTDGAPAMLSIAQEKLPNKSDFLQFKLIDFETDWADQFGENAFDAVTSTMALHHAEDKRRLFQQINRVLKPNGAFALGDHMAGDSDFEQYLIGLERALIKLEPGHHGDQEKILEQIQIDEWRQEREGNRCESVPQYLTYLSSSGFKDVCCPWKDFWLAVFIARKPAMQWGG
jgi:tRNA (cmo5U34)-methyltransferase